MKVNLLVLIALTCAADIFEVNQFYVQAKAKGGGGGGGGASEDEGGDGGIAIRDRNREFDAPMNEVLQRFLMI